MSGISYLQGIPQIFFLGFHLWRLAGPVKDFHILHLRAFQFWVGFNSVFVAPLEHCCLNLISLARGIKFSFSICLYLVPSCLPCIPTSLHDAVNTAAEETLHTADDLMLAYQWIWYAKLVILHVPLIYLRTFYVRDAFGFFLSNSSCHTVNSKIKGTIFTRIVWHAKVGTI